MISLNNLDELLMRNAVVQSEGRCVDHVLAKTPCLVRRDREYRVYLPQSYDGKKTLPVVFVLHGCQQNHQDIQSLCGFDAIADREHFIVVYPFVTSYSDMRSTNCWGWWENKQRLRNQGEVGDLQQIVASVVRDYAVDQSRLHICGLSSGAAMSVVALAAYSDIWKSGASVAGVPYGESARAVKFSAHLPVRTKSVTVLQRLLEKALVSTAPGLLIIQSTADQQVGIRLAQNLRDVWRNVLGIDVEKLPGSDNQDSSCNEERENKPSVTIMASASGMVDKVSWIFDQYHCVDKDRKMGYLAVDQLPHGWIGGNPGQYGCAEGPNVSELIWAFFNES